MAPAESPRRTRVECGIYRQPNRNYAVCARHAGRLHFRTVGCDLEAARRAREELVTALAAGKVPASPRLRFDTASGWWLERFEAKVAAGERHPRTLEAHRYHLEHNLLSRLASRRIAALGVEDVATLITELHGDGRSAKSTANALGTLQGILRFARRRGWVLADPVEVLEPEERPRHPRRHQRVLGRPEIERLLDAWPPLRFHDLRHAFASHLIVDLGLDVAQVSRILGHARITITLDVYTHLFDDSRHAREIRRRMEVSQFASLLDDEASAPPVSMLCHPIRSA